jgi:hypothetical protein
MSEVLEGIPPVHQGLDVGIGITLLAVTGIGAAAADQNRILRARRALV